MNPNSYGATSMPQLSKRISPLRMRAPLWSVPDSALRDGEEVTQAAPAIDESSAAIDELAFVLATDQLSTLEKIWLLEQWRYDMLLLDLAAGEGLGADRGSGVLLQQINKALLLLARQRVRH
jgi:hypothetical protein